MRTFVSVIFWIVSATAYDITFPAAPGDKWYAGSTTNKLTWERKTTDPEYFTLMLSNGNESVIPGNNMDLIAAVAGLSGSIDVPTPSGGLPVGSGFRLTFLNRTSAPNTVSIDAFTQDFEIVSGTPDPASNKATTVALHISPVLAAGVILATFFA